MRALWTPALLLAACSGPDWSDPAQVAAAATDARIIEAIIENRVQDWQSRGHKVHPIKVVKTIGGAIRDPQYFDRTRANGLGWGRPATWDAFFSAQSRRLRIPPDLSFKFGFVGESHEPPEGGGDFYFAALSVSDDGQEALVYCSWYCGPLCGDGWISRLVFENGVWRVANEQGLWVS